MSPRPPSRSTILRLLRLLLLYAVAGPSGMADEDSFGDDSFGDTGRGGGAGDDDFDDSFEGAFGGGPGDENPMTQVRPSAALSYHRPRACTV